MALTGQFSWRPTCAEASLQGKSHLNFDSEHKHIPPVTRAARKGY